MTTTLHRQPVRRSAPRGVSLIEGMVASGVLLFGLIGVLQGVMFASTQNSMAGRLTRAGAITQQMMSGLQARGRARLVDGTTGIFRAGNCANPPSTLTTAKLAAQAGDLYPMPPGLPAGFTACYVDLDNNDTVAPAAQKIMPGYDPADAAIFRRTIAYYYDPANTELAYVGVVVAWTDAGRTRTIDQFFALYDPAVNQTGQEL